MLAARRIATNTMTPRLKLPLLTLLLISVVFALAYTASYGVLAQARQRHESELASVHIKTQAQIHRLELELEQAENRAREAHSELTRCHNHLELAHEAAIGP